MKARLATFWREHRFVFIGFVAAALLTIFFTIKIIGGVIYWSQHRNAELEPWMSIGYIAHSYRVPPRVLADALALTRDEAKHKPIGEIAEDAGMEFPRLRSEILTAIDTARDRRDQQ